MSVPVRSSDLDHYIKRIDYASATIQYVGLSFPGTLTSQALWQIQRLTLDSNSRVIAVDFANGNANLGNVWDNRSTYSYS